MKAVVLDGDDGVAAMQVEVADGKIYLATMSNKGLLITAAALTRDQAITLVTYILVLSHEVA